MYGRLEQFERMIQDFDEAIMLEPQYAIACKIRRLIYGNFSRSDGAP